MQSLVARGSPLTMSYQAALDGAMRLLVADIGSLRLLDREDEGWMIAVAWSGSAGTGERWRLRAPVSEGLSGQVISTGRPADLHELPPSGTRSRLAPVGAQTLLGAPLRADNHVFGSLLVGSMEAGRCWTSTDRGLLDDFARHVAVALLVAERDHVVRQASVDPLTGLGNRGLLLDRLEHELVRADRGAMAPTILYMDLDDFKSVNDRLGHLAGDQLLAAVAERLRHCLRGGDLCARLGGDEFAVLLAAGSDASAIARRIISAFDPPFEIADSDISIAISIGIATGSGDAHTLLRNADRAMYEAKRTGCGCFEHNPSAAHGPGKPGVDPPHDAGPSIRSVKRASIGRPLGLLAR